SYWSTYQLLSLRNADVEANQDGSVNVSVSQLAYTLGGVPKDQQPQLRVTRIDGRLLIDSDPR
ncbi:MAG: hypothetical protein ACRDTG_14975, partial [Pseudonocardiaceae bacterium]